MKQASGDLWRVPADARCITVNGAVRKDGCAVMGRGVAAQARERWPLVQAVLGHQIRAEGNHVRVVMKPAGDLALLVSFPVKHSWHEAADLALIERSCGELMDLVERLGLRTVLLAPSGLRKWPARLGAGRSGHRPAAGRQDHHRLPGKREACPIRHRGVRSPEDESGPASVNSRTVTGT